LDAFGLVNMNARLYDPKLGRLLGVDNYVSDPASPLAYNRYTYALNNPISYVDPSGNHPLLVAMAIGAAISAATYTAQSAMAPGGLSHNFNIGDFASTSVTGAALGALSWGVGEAFGATWMVGVSLDNGKIISFGMAFTHEAGRAAAHGFIGAGYSATQGGDFVTGFVSGSVSAFAGHALAMGGVNLGKVGGAFFSAGMGAGTSYMQGGDPWIGGGAALMSYLLNQLPHDGNGDEPANPKAILKTAADVTQPMGVALTAQEQAMLLAVMEKHGLDVKQYRSLTKQAKRVLIQSTMGTTGRTILRGVRVAGGVINLVGATSALWILLDDHRPGNALRLVVNIVGVGVNAVPYVGPALSSGIATLDSMFGDEVYKYFNENYHWTLW
jgi:RHS repeat-associated protein